MRGLGILLVLCSTAPCFNVIERTRPAARETSGQGRSTNGQGGSGRATEPRTSSTPIR